MAAAEELGKDIFSIIRDYEKTWSLLYQYDENNLTIPKKKEQQKIPLDLTRARNVIKTLKLSLLEKGEATDIFGVERNESLDGILGALQQTFGGQELYPSLGEKAANLLYLVVKDHPFTDGNKRIGAFLFIHFLQLNGLLDKNRFSNEALVSLTLLTAISDPGQKELLIKLIINLLEQEK